MFVAGNTVVKLEHSFRFLTATLSTPSRFQVAFPKQEFFPITAVSESPIWQELLPVVAKQVYDIFCQAEHCGVAVKPTSDKDFAVYDGDGVKLSTCILLSPSPNPLWLSRCRFADRLALIGVVLYCFS
jgi:hypothetical protein